MDRRDPSQRLVLTLSVLLQQGEFGRGQRDPLVLAGHRVQASCLRLPGIPRPAAHTGLSNAATTEHLSAPRTAADPAAHARART